MRRHDHDHLVGESLRPKANRVESEIDQRAVHAALTGRLDALTPDAVHNLQRAVGNSGTAGALANGDTIAEDVEQPARSPVHAVIASGGEPLAPDIRADMEARLGHDFGDVRVHTDNAAHDSARSVNAHAYTVGSHVVFQRSAFDPGSHEGATTLAHELTHVIQQRSGPVEGTPAEGGVQVSDPSDRFEREASARATEVMARPAPAMQRQSEEAPEEKAVQGSFLQRSDEGTEEELAE